MNASGIEFTRIPGSLTPVSRKALDAEIDAESGKIKKRSAETRAAIARSVKVGKNAGCRGKNGRKCAQSDGSLDNENGLEFRAGDKAVYPSHGVVDVIGIEEKDIAGQRQKFYVLNILDTDQRIMVPIQKTDSVGMRRLSSIEETDDVFSILREPPNSYENCTWNRVYRILVSKIGTSSIYEAAEVVRDLLYRQSHHKLSFGEKRILEIALGFIVKEIAIVRGQSYEQAKEEIEALSR